jgi:3-deoxy-manno-octulosonate cytidylyltransferase (CMP-KDO synthetase)
MSDVLVVIPARLQASRLPGKLLEKIGGEAMIVQVWRRAVEADLGPVLVAADSPAITDVVEAAGGRALLTGTDHASGSDRVYEAISKVDPKGSFEFIVNLQGDLPTLQPELLAACVAPLRQGDADIATLAAEIRDEGERDDPNVVKVVATQANDSHALRALYFTRATAPAGEGPLYHHIGLYAFRRAALKRFISLPPSPLERREKLEHLRALEDGMRIDVALVDTVPLGVDTPADLERARALMAGQD